MLGVDPLVAGHEFAVEHDLRQRFAIDGIIECLADFGFGSERTFCFLAIGDIDIHALIAEFERSREPQLGIGTYILDVSREQRSIRSRPPDLRLARRTVESTIGR